MKLDQQDVTIEKSDNQVVSYGFGVKDPAIIFEILCTKLYENPLKVLVQEYMCNARDAHRENGNEDEPIEVVLPTKLFPTLKIKDNGVGISPYRMKDVFIFMGESTKKLSDNETGGHGVGAKTGWAYTDSFNVRTIYNGVEYLYLAYIGNGKLGYIDLIEQKPTTERNGTTIEIDIKLSDFQNTEHYVNRTCHFWPVRPIIKNKLYIQEFHEPSTNYIDTDGNMIGSCVENTSSCSYLYEDKNKTFIVLDGIIYRELSNYIDTKDNLLIPKENCSLYLHFSIAELKPTINRENIQISDKYINCIKNNNNKFKEFITKDFKESLDKAGSFDELINEIYNYDQNKMMIISQWVFNFKGVDITYMRNVNEFRIYLDSKYFTVQGYKYDRSTGFLKIDKGYAYINIKNIKNKICILNDKFSKYPNKDVIKQYLQLDEFVNNEFIYIIQPNKVTGKDVILNDNKDLMTLINEIPKISELIKKFKNAPVMIVHKGIPVGKKNEVIKVQILDNRRKLKYDNLFEYINRYKYIIDFESESSKYYHDLNSINSITKKYNSLFGQTFKLVIISPPARKKIAGRFSDIFISPSAALEMMYKEFEENLKDDDYKYMVKDKLVDIDYRHPWINKLNKLKNTISDCELIKFIEKIKNFKDKFNNIDNKYNRYYRDIDELVSGYKSAHNILNMSRINTRYSIMMKHVERKNNIYKKNIELFVKKYPLIDLLNNYNTNINDIVEYINNKTFVLKHQQENKHVVS